MFDLFKRKITKQSAEEYINDIVAILLSDGFEPKWLDEVLSHSEKLKVNRMYAMLQKKKLSPIEAAKAIEVGTHFFNEKESEAEEAGWPLEYTDKVPPEYSRRECFYLEQIVDSAKKVMKRRK